MLGAVLTMALLGSQITCDRMPRYVRRQVRLAAAYWDSEYPPVVARVHWADLGNWLACTAVSDGGADIWINSKAKWRGRGHYSLYKTLLHEFGHVLGWPDSDDPSSIMYRFGYLEIRSSTLGDLPPRCAASVPSAPHSVLIKGRSCAL